MVSTVAGYAGGKKSKPTYNLIGDHTETVMVVFDPARISYEKLLGAFAESHDPFSESGPRQYRNAVFATNEDQLKRARDFLRALGEKAGKEVKTEVELADQFTPAEDYHQKYYLRQNPDFYRALRERYRSEADFLSSTAAARLNGYLGGNGKLEEFTATVEKLGLPPRLTEELKRQASRRLK